jgi:hypothetical protein
MFCNTNRSAAAFLAHLAFRPCELLSSLFVRRLSSVVRRPSSVVRRLSSVVRRPSVNISHFNLLLRNHWTNCNQTLVEWSLDGPLSNLCPVIPTSNQDGRQAKNRKRGDEILIVHCCFGWKKNFKKNPRTYAKLFLAQFKFELILTYTKAAMDNWRDFYF